MHQGIEKVTIQLIDTPTKVYAIGAMLFISKVPLEVLQNWVLCGAGTEVKEVESSQVGLYAMKFFIAF